MLVKSAIGQRTKVFSAILYSWGNEEARLCHLHLPRSFACVNGRTFYLQWPANKDQVESSVYFQAESIKDIYSYLIIIHIKQHLILTIYSTRTYHKAWFKRRILHAPNRIAKLNACKMGHLNQYFNSMRVSRTFDWPSRIFDWSSVVDLNAAFYMCRMELKLCK